IVAEKVSLVQRVKIPTAGDWISSLRNRETLKGARRTYYRSTAELKREVRDHPAIFKRVVKDNRVAEIVGVAQIAEVALAHQGIKGERRYQIASRLVVDADRSIDSLNIMIWTNVADCIRWMAVAPRVEVQAFKAAGRRRRGSTWCRNRSVGSIA